MDRLLDAETEEQVGPQRLGLLAVQPLAGLGFRGWQTIPHLFTFTSSVQVVSLVLPQAASWAASWMLDEEWGSVVTLFVWHAAGQLRVCDGQLLFACLRLRQKSRSAAQHSTLQGSSPAKTSVAPQEEPH